MSAIQLVENSGCLYYPDSVKNSIGHVGPIVLRVYPEGDCDTIKWPNPNMENLRAALFDDRETGLNQGEVLLPNGERVDF